MHGMIYAGSLSGSTDYPHNLTGDALRASLVYGVVTDAPELASGLNTTVQGGVASSVDDWASRLAGGMEKWLHREFSSYVVGEGRNAIGAGVSLSKTVAAIDARLKFYRGVKAELDVLHSIHTEFREVVDRHWHGTMIIDGRNYGALQAAHPKRDWADLRSSETEKLGNGQTWTETQLRDWFIQKKDYWKDAADEIGRFIADAELRKIRGPGE